MSKKEKKKFNEEQKRIEEEDRALKERILKKKRDDAEAALNREKGILEPKKPQKIVMEEKSLSDEYAKNNSK